MLMPVYAYGRKTATKFSPKAYFKMLSIVASKCQMALLLLLLRQLRSNRSATGEFDIYMNVNSNSNSSNKGNSCW